MSLIPIFKVLYNSTFKSEKLIDVQTTGSSLDSVVVAVNDQTSLKVLLYKSSNCEAFFKSKVNLSKLMEREHKELNSEIIIFEKHVVLTLDCPLLHLLETCPL